jgi:hypothetical protein
LSFGHEIRNFLVTRRKLKNKIMQKPIFKQGIRATNPIFSRHENGLTCKNSKEGKTLRV